MNGYYYAVTENTAEAAKVIVEQAEGGYNLKVVKVDGSVVYMDIVASGTHINGVFVETPTTPFAYNEEFDTFTKEVEGLVRYIGTYGTYSTMSPSSIDKAATSFVAHLYDIEGEQPEPKHEHVACPECGKCTADDCDGTEEEQCAGHEEKPEPEQNGEVELTVDSLGIASQTYASSTATVNGVAFEFIQIGNYGNGIQMRIKEGRTGSIWNKTAVDTGIKSLKLTHSATKNTYDTEKWMKVEFANTADFANAEVIYLDGVKGQKDYEVTPSVATYKYVRFSSEATFTSYWSSIIIDY